MSELRVSNLLSPYVRFVNACPGRERVDFYHGNTLLQPGLGFGCFSTYFKVPDGVREFTIREEGPDGEVIAEVKIPFGKGEVYTVAAVHSDGGTMAYGILEPTERRDTDYGHVRVCQLSPGVNTMDISAGGHAILRGIDYLEVSRYICMLPGEYRFEARQTGSDTPSLIMPGQKVAKGKYNTIYIMGQQDSGQGIIGVFTMDAASYTGYTL